MKISDCNPFIRAIEIQPAVLEGSGLRYAYDHRIFYVLDGEGKIIFSDKEELIEPDTFIFINPQTGYYFSGKIRVAVINFDVTRECSNKTEPLCPPSKADFDYNKLFDTTVLDEFPTKFVIKEDGFFKEAILNLVRDFSEKRTLYEVICSAKLKQILAEALIRVSKNTDSETRLAEKVYGFIRLNAPNISGNEHIAKELGYHPVYIGNVFKKITGKTLHSAVYEERIRLACKWLTQTDRSIEEIAFDTGFSSRSHFCTAFKSVMKVTPLNYRNR